MSSNLNFIFVKTLSICISILIYLLSKVLLRLSNGNHTPASLYCSFWFFFTFFPAIFLYNVPLWPFAIFYILISCIAFSLPSLFFNWKYMFFYAKINSNIIHIFQGKLFKQAYLISFVLSFYFLVLMLKQNGFNLTLFLIDFLGTSTQFANNRTLYDYQYGWIGQLASFFPFLTASLGGFIFFHIKNKTTQIGVFLISIFPATISMLLQSSKLIFLYGILFYLSGTLILRIFSGNKRLIPPNSLKYLFFLIIFFIPLLLIAFQSREGYNQMGLIELVPTISSYFFGSVYAFSDYFNYKIGLESISIYFDEETLSFGYYSFKPLFDMFGGTKVFPIGYYEDFFNFDDSIKSNIFTYFRQLIQDFGILGSILFILFISYFIHLFYFFLLKIKNPFLSLSVIFIFLVFLGMSYLINIFTARTVIMIGFALYCLLSINYLFKKPPNIETV